MDNNALVVENLGIWDRFVEQNQATVRGLSLAQVPEAAVNSIVIIEPRCHPHLEFVLRSALYFLGANWSVNIFAGKKNYNFINEITCGLGPVQIHSLDVDDLTADQYNSIKKSAWLWRNLSAENILWLEPDCLICRPGIEEFMHYDYIGAPWHRKFTPSPSCRIGNGGLSFRKRLAMLKIAETANADNDLILTEDVFFVTNMHMANRIYPKTFKLPDLEAAKSFAVEAVFHPQPFGLHKTWRYLHPKFLSKLIASIQY